MVYGFSVGWFLAGGFEFGDVKGGEAGFELVFEMFFGLGNEIILVAELSEEVGEDGNLSGVMAFAQGNTLFLVVAPITNLATFHTFQ